MPHTDASNVIVCCGTPEENKSCARVKAALEEIGVSATVFPCCWYVLTPLAASDVKAKLLPAMGEGESLFVVDATNHEAAWGNISPNAAELIRETWASGAVPSLPRRMEPTRALRDGEGVAAASPLSPSVMQRMEIRSE